MKKIVSAVALAAVATLGIFGTASASNIYVKNNEDSTIGIAKTLTSIFTRVGTFNISNTNTSTTSTDVVQTNDTGLISFVADDDISGVTGTSGDIAAGTEVQNDTETGTELTVEEFNCACTDTNDTGDVVVEENEDATVGVSDDKIKVGTDTQDFNVTNTQDAVDDTEVFHTNLTSGLSAISLTDGISNSALNS